MPTLPRVNYYDQNTERHYDGLLLNWMHGQPIVLTDGETYLLPDNDLVLIDGQRLSEWKQANWSHPWVGA